MLRIPENAILEIKGKTKNGYVVPGDDKTIYFNFKDTQTVNEKGEIDPGGNKVGSNKTPGVGLANLVLTTYFFKLFENILAIPTHMIDSDLDNGIMHVKRAKLYGYGRRLPVLYLTGEELGNRIQNVSVDGLEVINRRMFTGSSLDFDDNLEDMMELKETSPSYVHFTIKNDHANDPRISRRQIVENGLMLKPTIERIVVESQAIETLVQTLAKWNGYKVVDFKTEHGVTKYNEHLLVDEFGTGTCRILGNNNSPKPFNKVEAFLGSEISDDVQNLRTEGLNKKVEAEIKKVKRLWNYGGAHYDKNK